MKRSCLILACLFLVSLNAGCQTNKTRVAEGAVLGGLAGAGVGGIIGHQSGHGGEGAGIGAAVGALTGAIIGGQMQKPGAAQQPAQVQQQYAATNNPNQIPIQQVASMAQQGINEDVIIDKIRLSNSRYSLSESDINYLKENGATQKVISAMQQ